MKLFNLNPFKVPPSSWTAHAHAIWGKPLAENLLLAWKKVPDAEVELTPNVVLLIRKVLADERAADLELISDLHKTLAALRNTPCVKGYPGLDELLVKAEARKGEQQ